MTDAFCGIDESWRLTYLNKRAAELLPRDAEDLLGDQIWDRFRALRGTELEEQFRDAMATGEPTAFEFHFAGPDLDLAIDAYPSDTGLSVYFRDVTEEKERKRELRELSERLRLAVEGADAGVWDWNIRTDEVRFDERWASMLGYDRSEIAFDLAGWEERVHPDDLSAVWSALGALFRCDGAIPVRLPDGDEGRRVEVDPRPRPRCRAQRRGRAGSRRRDPHRRDGGEKRERDLKRYRRLVDELPDSVAVYDADGRFSVVNDRIVDVYDSTPRKLSSVGRARSSRGGSARGARTIRSRRWSRATARPCLERSNSTFPSGPTRSSTSASSGSLSTASSTGCSASPAT